MEVSGDSGAAFDQRPIGVRHRVLWSSEAARSPGSKVSGVRDWVAVLGGAYKYTEEQIVAGYRTGCEIARLGRHVVTGATTGVSYAAALGARSSGSLAVGISPAADTDEHSGRYAKSLDGLDLIVYSGLGFDGRSPLIIRSAATAIFIGGEFGTLNEFTSAWMTGNKIVGVLEGAGGITDRLRELTGHVQTRWGCETLFDEDPVRLVQRVLAALDLRPPDAAQEEAALRHGADVRDTVARYLAREAFPL